MCSVKHVTICKFFFVFFISFLSKLSGEASQLQSVIFAHSPPATEKNCFYFPFYFSISFGFSCLMIVITCTMSMYRYHKIELFVVTSFFFSRLFIRMTFFFMLQSHTNNLPSSIFFEIYRRSCYCHHARKHAKNTYTKYCRLMPSDKNDIHTT